MWATPCTTWRFSFLPFFEDGFFAAVGVVAAAAAGV